MSCSDSVRLVVFVEMTRGWRRIRHGVAKVDYHWDALQYRRMTSEEVLAVLVATAEVDDARDDWLTFESSVGDWWFATTESLSTWRTAAKHLNYLFGIDCALTQWRGALTPMRKRSLRELCNFISAHAQVPEIPVPTFFGKPCRPAGAFLTLRAMLSSAGADTSDLRPSTPLARYATKGLAAIELDLLKLSPRVHPVVVRQNDYDVALTFLAALLFFSTVSFGLVTAVRPVLGGPLLASSLAGFLWIWQWSEKLSVVAPRRVVCEGLSDFRDLSMALAGQR